MVILFLKNEKKRATTSFYILKLCTFAPYNFSTINIQIQ